jgi:short-subunit dehydrogenase
MQPGRDLALVTGASSGIGAELARQLAAHRIDLVLVARRRERLEALAAELIERHAVKATAIAADLGTASGVDGLLAELAQRRLEPSVLINNAGFGYFGPFLDQSWDEIDAMIEVNLRAATRLTRALGEAMVRERYGYILNVSSFAALAPIPRYAVYSSAKAYLIAMTQALAFEWRKKGVKVCVLCPGFTRTEFHDVARHRKSRLMRLTELTPEHVARAGLEGLSRGKLLIVPGLWYKLNLLGQRLYPRSWVAGLSAMTVRTSSAENP